MGRLLLYDALEMRFREIKVRRDPCCPLCGPNPTITTLVDYEQFCGIHPQPAMTQPHPDEVTVHDLKRALGDPGLGIKVLDVREPDEYRLAHLEGAALLPLSELPRRYSELDPNQAYYLHCKAGGRSLKALQFLREHGFKNLKSVRGGITAWSKEIDQKVPTY